MDDVSGNWGPAVMMKRCSGLTLRLTGEGFWKRKCLFSPSGRQSLGWMQYEWVLMVAYWFVSSPMVIDILSELFHFYSLFTDYLFYFIYLFVYFYYVFTFLHTRLRTEQYKLIYKLENSPTRSGRQPWTGVPPTLAYAIN